MEPRHLDVHGQSIHNDHNCDMDRVPIYGTGKLCRVHELILIIYLLVCRGEFSIIFPTYLSHVPIIHYYDSCSPGMIFGEIVLVAQNCVFASM